MFIQLVISGYLGLCPMGSGRSGSPSKGLEPQQKLQRQWDAPRYTAQANLQRKFVMLFSQLFCYNIYYQDFFDMQNKGERYD